MLELGVVCVVLFVFMLGLVWVSFASKLGIFVLLV